MKLGIYGGTYNPVHSGHINAAINATDELGLDKLLLIPTGIPPHKELPGDTATAEDRLAMLHLASERDDRLCVSDIEIKREGKSYTVDTLIELKREYPDAELFLLIGTDMIRIFEKWVRFEDILNMVTLVVSARAEDDEQEISALAENLRVKYSARVIVAENNIVEISSSQIRGDLKDRKGTEYLDDKVYSYIIQKRLYDAKPNLEWLRTKSYAMLKPKRIPHVQGCEAEAAKLAEHWGADVIKAREAAILHDCTKKLSLEEQLALCAEYGIEMDDVERNSEKLLHSKTGAEIARRTFGMDSDIYDAILWHTTGRENMTLLEKIIYMADYIEPTRDFNGLDKLRSLAYENLDGAMVLGLEMSLEDMSANGIIPHIRSRSALEYLKKQLQDE